MKQYYYSHKFLLPRHLSWATSSFYSQNLLGRLRSGTPIGVSRSRGTNQVEQNHSYLDNFRVPVGRQLTTVPYSQTSLRRTHFLSIQKGTTQVQDNANGYVRTMTTATSSPDGPLPHGTDHLYHHHKPDSATRIQAAKTSVPEFQTYRDEDFYVEPLRGGLTNLLWTVGLKVQQESIDIEGEQGMNNKKPKNNANTRTIALVREYGRGTESFMNRIQEERVVSKLCEKGLCPRVYGVFPWGRVEQYLCNSRTLSTVEYASHEYLPRVAHLLGKFHAQSTHLMPLATVSGETSRLSERLHHWYGIASQVRFEGDAEAQRKQRKLEALDFGKSIKDEVEWLLDEIEQIGSRVVFCHCDLQDGNVLLHNNELHMIDFEYSDRLERGFDLGNCFCEMSLDYRVTNYPGFVVYPDMFPDHEKQVKFLKAYAEGAGIEFNEANKKQLLREANLFVMGSHLHWAIWSVVQARNSTIEFGYMEYAEQRMDQYYHFKRKVWPEIRATASV